MDMKERQLKTVLVKLTDMHGNPHSERRCTVCGVRIRESRFCLCYTKKMHNQHRYDRIKKLLNNPPGDPHE